MLFFYISLANWVWGFMYVSNEWENFGDYVWQRFALSECILYRIKPQKLPMLLIHFKVDVIKRSSSGDMRYFTQNGEWEVIDFPNRRNVIYYSNFSVPFPDVTFYLIIRRKPLYYVFNLVLPCIFITATSVLVFYLPAESGEKVLTNIFPS